MEIAKDSNPREDYFARWDKVDWDEMLKEEGEAEERQEKHMLQLEKETKQNSKLINEAAVETMKESKLLAAKARVAALKAKKVDPRIKHLSEEEKQTVIRERRATADALAMQATELSIQSNMYEAALNCYKAGQALSEGKFTSHEKQQQANDQLEIAFTKIEALAQQLPEQGGHEHRNETHKSHDHSNCCGHSHHNHSECDGAQEDAKKTELDCNSNKLHTAARKLRDQIAVELGHMLVETGHFVRAAQILQPVLVRSRSFERAWVERGLAYMCMGSPLLAELHLVQPEVSKYNKHVKELLARIRKTVAADHDMVLKEKIEREQKEGGRQMELLLEYGSMDNQAEGKLPLLVAQRLVAQGDQLVEELFHYSATCKYFAAVQLLIHEYSVDQNAVQLVPQIARCIIQLGKCFINRNSHLRLTVTLSSWMIMLAPVCPSQLAWLWYNRGQALEHLGYFSLALEDLGRTSKLVRNQKLDIDQHALQRAIRRVTYLRRQIGDRPQTYGVSPIGWFGGSNSGAVCQPFTRELKQELPSPNILLVVGKCGKPIGPVSDLLAKFETTLGPSIVSPVVELDSGDAEASIRDLLLEDCAVPVLIALENTGYKTCKIEQSQQNEVSSGKKALNWLYDYIRQVRESRKRDPFALVVVLETSSKEALERDLEEIVEGCAHFPTLMSHTITTLTVVGSELTSNLPVTTSSFSNSRRFTPSPRTLEVKKTEKVEDLHPYSRCKVVISLRDVAASLLGFCEVDCSDGRDLSGVLIGSDSSRLVLEQPDNEVFSRNSNTNTFSVISPAVILHEELTELKGDALVQVYKLTQTHTGEMELFNLSLDPNQEQNIIQDSRHHAICIRLQKKLESHYSLSSSS